MGFYVTTRSESASPKTHTRRFSCGSKNAYRLLRVENPGLRFYSATLSRWISRDPIGEQSFLIEYGRGMSWPRRRELMSASLRPAYLFLENRPSDRLDLHGLTSFWICRRASSSAPFHDYVYYGSSPWGKTPGGQGVGFGAGVTTDPNFPPGVYGETNFDPYKCASCSTQTTGNLVNDGVTAKTSCKCATPAQIWTCISKHKPTATYSTFAPMYTCTEWALEAAKACCLSCKSPYSGDAPPSGTPTPAQPEMNWGKMWAYALGDTFPSSN